MSHAATSDGSVVVAIKLAVPNGAEVTVKTSPISIAPQIVIAVCCFTGTTDAIVVGLVIFQPVLSL